MAKKKTEPNEPVVKSTSETEEFVVNFNVDLEKLLAESIHDYVETNASKITKNEIVGLVTDHTKVMKKYLEEEIKKLRPVMVQIGSRQAVKITGRVHERFTECLFICEQEGQLLIVGPAGSGKTTLGKQIADSFKLRFAHISCSAGLSEAHLLGRMLFNGEYVESEFVNIYEKGGVFLFDEIDAADANTMLIINSALANGYLSVPNRSKKQTASRHKDFICVCAANTYGTGSYEYQGRNHLDAAFLDRFSVAKVPVGYDEELEREIASSYQVLITALHYMRKNLVQHRIKRVISTRAFVSGTRQMMAGKSVVDIVHRITLGWTDEEKKKVCGELYDPYFVSAQVTEQREEVVNEND